MMRGKHNCTYLVVDLRFYLSKTCAADHDFMWIYVVLNIKSELLLLLKEPYGTLDILENLIDLGFPLGICNGINYNLCPC
jgi:hypothetical protein